MLNFFTHKDDAKKAIELYENKKKSYEQTVDKIKQCALRLFNKREDVLDEAVNLYNKLLLIDAFPADFIKQIESQLKKQQIKRMSVSDNHLIYYDIPNEENSQTWKYMFGAAGVGGGAAVAGGSILTALATTFGTASTGAAISSLSGAAASNAILAWIGGGAVAAGGGGMALGGTILGLMGPIGWGIAGFSIVGGGFSLRNKNDKIIAECQKAAKEYQYHNNLLKTKVDEVRGLIFDTDANLKLLRRHNSIQFPCNFTSCSDENKLELGKMVSDMLASLRHLNKAVV